MLKEINFKNSIRGEVIQENFEFLDKRDKRESIIVGGKGIIEGLEITVLDDQTISVSDGSFIDHDGSEVFFKQRTFKIKPMEPIHKKTERLEVNSQGEIVLPDRPYSVDHKGYFTTAFYNYLYPTNSLVIRSSTDGTKIKAVSVEQNIITVDADMWAGRGVFVEYLYARNRMDTVMINATGVLIATGTMSTSVSYADEIDYSKHFVIGAIEVVINEGQKLVVHNAERDVRNVYVNPEGVLMLDGKPYRRIYFVVPDDPMLDDIYIDKERNHIYVYTKNELGYYEWELMNTRDYMPKTEVRIFSPDEFPADKQTFHFSEEDRRLFFIPEEHQLDIIIDNTIVMSDQYEEILSGTSEINSGVGFRLKDPLEKETFVEVRVTNFVQNAPVNKVFQRTATFAKENLLYKDATNTDSVFETPISYAAGEHQLEVFAEGKRLVRDVEFIEVDENHVKVTEGQHSYFKILIPLRQDQIIVSRVSKNIYTYDHIGDILETSMEKVDEAVKNMNELQATMKKDFEDMKEDFDIEQKILTRKIEALEEENTLIRQELLRMDNMLLKTDKIKASQLEASIQNALVKKAFEKAVPCAAIVTVDDLDVNDYIVAHLISKTGSRPLIKGADYTVTGLSVGIILTLDEAVVDPLATILLSGIQIGG